MLTLSLFLACSPSAENDNATRCRSPVTTDDDSATDTASDTADTGVDVDTGGNTTTDTTDTQDTGSDTAEAIVDGPWTGEPQLVIANTEFGTYACDARGVVTVPVTGTTFLAAGQCGSDNLGLWTSVFTGTVDGGTLTATGATVQSEAYSCATHTVEAGSSTLTAAGGTFSFSFATDDSPCGAPYVWHGEGLVTLTPT